LIYSLSTLLAVTAGAAGLDGGLLDLNGGDTGQLLEVQGLEKVLLKEREKGKRKARVVRYKFVLVLRLWRDGLLMLPI